jgi:hypothetical protein
VPDSVWRPQAYEVSSVKEHAAATKLLNPSHGLSDPAHIKLLGDLRAIRKECNEDMRAIAAHHKKKLGLSTLDWVKAFVGT